MKGSGRRVLIGMIGVRRVMVRRCLVDERRMMNEVRRSGVFEE